MKHQIDYSETIDGLEYTIVTEDYFKPVLDLFFDVFVKGTLDYLISVPHLLSVPTDKFRKIN